MVVSLSPLIVITKITTITIEMIRFHEMKIAFRWQPNDHCQCLSNIFAHDHDSQHLYNVCSIIMNINDVDNDLKFSNVTELSREASEYFDD